MIWFVAAKGLDDRVASAVCGLVSQTDKIRLIWQLTRMNGSRQLGDGQQPMVRHAQLGCAPMGCAPMGSQGLRQELELRRQQPRHRIQRTNLLKGNEKKWSPRSRTEFIEYQEHYVYYEFCCIANWKESHERFCFQFVHCATSSRQLCVRIHTNLNILIGWFFFFACYARFEDSQVTDDFSSESLSFYIRFAVSQTIGSPYSLVCTRWCMTMSATSLCNTFTRTDEYVEHMRTMWYGRRLPATNINVLWPQLAQPNHHDCWRHHS